MQSQWEFELSEMSYSKYNLHHLLFSPFLSTVNFTDPLQFFSYDSEIYEAMLYPILCPSTFFLVVDTGKLGKIRRIHWKERLEIAKFESDTSSQSCINLRIIVRFWETAHILLP